MPHTSDEKREYWVDTSHTPGPTAQALGKAGLTIGLRYDIIVFYKDLIPCDHTGRFVSRQ